MLKELKQRLASFGYAIRGLADVVRTQPNARIHLVATIAVIVAGWYFSITGGEWCIVILCLALVFALEAINTALEYWVDLVSPQHHPLAGKAKDAAAAAVLIAAIGAATIGLIIFGPRIASMWR